jgi:type I restriction enzyme R subunit
MIDKYNTYSVNLEVQMEELFDLINDLNRERKRSAKEDLTEEELAILDIVSQRDKVDLKAEERKQIKKGIKKLIEKLGQEKLVQDWKKQQRYISDVKVTIQREFDEVLPEGKYNRALFTQTCNQVFDYVYQRY